MSLESKSQELKGLVAKYDTQWFLGDMNFLMTLGKERAKDQLGSLSSPQRQLYYLAGLNVSSGPAVRQDTHYTPEEWDRIVVLLNEIETEYDNLSFSNPPDEVKDDWILKRKVAVPSFLS